MKNYLSRFTFFILITLLILFGLLNCHSKVAKQTSTQSEPIPPLSSISNYINADWAMNSLWDDGNAEVAIYSAERIVYGVKRSFDYTAITVKEDFNQQYNVKTDDYTRKDLYTVLKVNLQCNFQTDYYWYHYLTSIFISRNHPDNVMKISNGSQELCGNTYKEFIRKPDGFSYHYHSYFDGQGDGESIITDRGALFEDQLIYTLRALKFQDGLSFNAKVIPTIITNQARALTPYDSQFKVSDAAFEDGAKKIPAWKVIVMLNEKTSDTFWFAKDYPNTMMLMICSDGRMMKLKETK